MSTMIFRRCNPMNDVLEGMQNSKKEMIEKGLWNDNTTFEDWANYAGRNVRISETVTFIDSANKFIKEMI